MKLIMEMDLKVSESFEKKVLKKAFVYWYLQLIVTKINVCQNNSETFKIKKWSRLFWKK
jgi:hypothetical protein